MPALQIDPGGWLLGVRHCPSDNQDGRPEGVSVDLLVIHNISLPPGRFGGGLIEALFTNSLECAADPRLQGLVDLRVSAHLLIDRKGNITQFVSFNRRAWHAGVSCHLGREQCNDFSIGIELEGTDHTPYTDAQYRQLVRVTQCLRTCYPGITPERIVGHRDIAPGRKSDPGPAFDWELYRGLMERT